MYNFVTYIHDQFDWTSFLPRFSTKFYKTSCNTSLQLIPRPFLSINIYFIQIKWLIKLNYKFWTYNCCYMWMNCRILVRLTQKAQQQMGSKWSVCGPINGCCEGVSWWRGEPASDERAWKRRLTFDQVIYLSLGFFAELFARVGSHIESYENNLRKWLSPPGLLIAITYAILSLVFVNTYRYTAFWVSVWS